MNKQLSTKLQLGTAAVLAALAVSVTACGDATSEAAAPRTGTSANRIFESDVVARSLAAGQARVYESDVVAQALAKAQRIYESDIVASAK